MTFNKQIDYSKCTLCEECIDICPENAIKKVKNSICNKCPKYCMTYEVDCNYFKIEIDDSKCNSCNACISTCLVLAISNLL